MSTECNGGINSHMSKSMCRLFLFVFQEAHVFISAEKVEDVTEENIQAELNKVQANAPTQWARRSSRSADKEDLVVSLLYCNTVSAHQMETKTFIDTL